MQRVITADLDAFLGILPPRIRQPLGSRADLNQLLEMVLDLGRVPEARFPGADVVLSDQEVTYEDIGYVTAHLSPFGDDNRAGIERTLHRISALRNRAGRVVGLTCRVGRAVFGTIKIIEDLVQSGKSLLLLGRPGVGKTTMLREVARVLADDFRKRVIIVDTSNEIAGDGDIPHPAIGHARRLQVPTPALQHAVMIEAVENHMPEVIIIDEIGTELEAMAARTIAERGVQLVGTAHGNTLENLIMNPTLSDLVGGIQTVTLGDEEARRRGTQKSILERKAPPTFPVVVEIQSWERVAVHVEVARVVDDLLRGRTEAPEVRWLDEEGVVHRERSEPLPTGFRPAAKGATKEGPPTKIYPFGISPSRLDQALRDLRLNAEVVEKPEEANAFFTLKSFYRRKPQRLRDATSAGIPIYVLRNNSLAQIQAGLAHAFSPGPSTQDPLKQALQETEQAIEEVIAGEPSVELKPQNSFIRRLQHQMAERHHLLSRSVGKEPYRRVTIQRHENND